MRVWGVGSNIANKFYRLGMRNIEDLRNSTNLLTTQQQLGLKYYDDLNIKIPYDEVTEIFDVIKYNLEEVLPKEVVEAEVCGSYRRKKKFCSDIDVLVTRKDYGRIENLLEVLLEKLTKVGLLKET